MEFILGGLSLIILILLIAISKLQAKQSKIREVNKAIERKEADLQRSINELTKQHNQFSQSLVVLQQQRQLMEQNIEQEIVKKKEAVVEQVKEYEEHEKTKIQYILEKLSEGAQTTVQALLDDYENYQLYIKKKEQDITESLEDAAAKYVATISTFKQLDLEAQELTAYMIQLSVYDREDIDYLINEVVPKIHNSQLLNKLIWTEYIMKPTSELLKRILPDKDCSGIYKITHVPDKKAYIGRSTSVYKRLQEHIKSSLGVGTIADQWVHHEMRAKGIENFTFELVEECDKDKLGEREKHYISFFQTDQYGFNKTTGG